MEIAMDDVQSKKEPAGIKLSIILYINHCLALIRPGTTPQFVKYAQTTEHSNLASWDNDELELLIEQGRYQLERQRNQIRDLQTRSQFLLTTALGALLFAVNRLSDTLRSESNHSITWTNILLIFAVLLLFIGALGVASNIATKNLLGTINITLLSNVEPPRKLAVARAYLRCVIPGEETLATRFAIFWIAIMFLLIGTLLLAIAWVFG